MERVAGVQRRLRLDQVAGEQDSLIGQPDHDVALGMAAADVQQLHRAASAQVDDVALLEGDGRMREAAYRLDAGEQARHAARLRLEVGLAALVDQLGGPPVRDDLLGAERGGPKGAHRVVVRQRQVADRLGGVLPQLVEPDPRHQRRGARLDRQDAILAFDGAHVRVTLGGVGVHALGQQLERRDLGGDVGGRRKRFGHAPSYDGRPPAGRHWYRDR